MQVKLRIEKTNIRTFSGGRFNIIFLILDLSNLILELAKLDYPGKQQLLSHHHD